MPVTAAIITGVTAIAGLGMSMYSSYQSGKQQEAAYKAQAEGARYNQQVAEQNAQATENAGAYAEQQARLKAARLAGTQATGYAKSGVLMEGSPLDVMAETAALEEQDILATKYNYGVQAARYRSQAGFYGYEAQRQDNISGYPVQAGILKAGTSLLTTGAKLAQSWGGLGGSSKSTYAPGQFGSGGYGTEGL
jgi:hypothetical protein